VSGQELLLGHTVTKVKSAVPLASTQGVTEPAQSAKGAVKVVAPREVPAKTQSEVNLELGLDRVDCQEMARWQEATGQFTLTSYCNPFTSLPNVSFESRDCCGQHVWLDPPPNRLESALAHYASCKKKSPLTTSACILVPRHEGGSHWRRHLQGMRLLCEYPAGTALKFMCTTREATDGECEARAPTPVAPCKYPLQVWYDPKEGPSRDDEPGQKIQAYFPGDSAPRKKRNPHSFKAAAQGAWLTFDAVVGHLKCRVLVDTGATANFMSEKLADSLSASTKPTKEAPVHTAGGLVTVKGTCQPRLRIQGHGSSPQCLVLSQLVLDYDIVLGKPWLTQHCVHVECETGRCTVMHKGQRITLEPEKPGGQKEMPASTDTEKPDIKEVLDGPKLTHSLCSAQRLAKEWAKVPGARMFAMTLKPAEEKAAATNATPDAPEIPPELREVLDQYSGVFERNPRGSASISGGTTWDRVAAGGTAAKTSEVKAVAQRED